MLDKLIEISSSFRSMNTDVEVILCVDPDLKVLAERALKKTQQLFEKMEAALSRFDPASELSHLNASAGFNVKTSPLLFEVIKEALKASRTTGGVFDPTILPDLLASGYDRSFEKIAEGTRVYPLKAPLKKCCWQDVKIDVGQSSVYLPAGCGIDLGGIGKGWTVDKACCGLEIFDNFAIDAGGDIKVKGNKVDGLPWNIGVADPFNESRNVNVVELQTGAICTSTSTRRKWELAGISQHHLIDPRSGEPSRSGVIAATVIAGSAARAEIIAKAALILGPEAGLQFIESQPGTSGLLILKDKQVMYSASFRELLYAA